LIAPAVITLVEALGYRSLRHVSQPLGAFEVLAGPHGSGKTAFLDVIALLGRLVSSGLEAAVSERAANFADLVWMHAGDTFEVAVEARIPPARRVLLVNPDYQTVRYEAALGLEPETRAIAILEEKLLLRAPVPPEEQAPLFPPAPATILTGKGAKSVKTVVHKNPGGNDNFYDENGKGWDHAFRLGPRKSALANLPDDEAKFPVATWLRDLLASGIRRLAPVPAVLRHPSPPGQPREFRPDGANLPWVVERFAAAHPARFAAWLAQLQAALPDLAGVDTVEREDDRHRYLVLDYRNGFAAPSWMASEGTLRLAALTLAAALPDAAGVWLVEKPESGLHPCAVEAVYDALAAASGPQVLVSTHSPVILARVPAERLRRFTLTPEGATTIA